MVFNLRNAIIDNDTLENATRIYGNSTFAHSSLRNVEPSQCLINGFSGHLSNWISNNLNVKINHKSSDWNSTCIKTIKPFWFKTNFDCSLDWFHPGGLGNIKIDCGNTSTIKCWTWTEEYSAAHKKNFEWKSIGIL